MSEKLTTSKVKEKKAPVQSDKKKEKTPKKAIKAKKARLSFQNAYYSDITMPGMLHAAIVRSPEKKGIVTSIQTPELPDGYFFFTARDVPGSNIIDTHLGKVPVFSEGNISYMGEPLGIIAGPDLEKVRDFAERTVVIVDKNTIEDYLKSFEADLTKNTSRKRRRISENPLSADGITEKMEKRTSPLESAEDFFSTVLAKRIVKKGPVFEEENPEEKLKGIFETAPHLVSGCWSSSVKSPDYNEPLGAICSFSEGNLSVWTPTQWLSNLRELLSSSLQLDSDHILINKTNSKNRGTTFIWYNSIVACQVAVASYKTGLPVKLVYSREEQEDFIDSTLPITIIHKTAADDKGHIVAQQVDIDIDAGSSNPFAQEIVDRLVIASTGLYNPLNMIIRATAYSSTNPSSSINMLLIDSPGFFAVENQINELAEKCGMSPLEFRLNNIRQFSGQNNFTPWEIDIEKPGEVFYALAEKSDFNRKYASYHLDSLSRSANPIKQGLEGTIIEPMRGIGFSCAYEGSGYFGSELNGNGQSLEVTFLDKDNLIIHSPQVSPSMAQIWTNMASSLLGIKESQVKLDTSADEKDEPELPENVYSNISVMTFLLKKCCESLAKKRNKGIFPITVKKSLSNKENLFWNNEVFTGKPFHSSSFVAATVEVEMDPCTFREKIRSICLVINGGQIVSPKSAENQIKFSVQKILRSLVKDDRVSVEKLQISFMKSDRPPTQIGELVEQVIPSAYTQALTQALGCTINSLPLESDSLYKRLCEKEIHEKAVQLAKETKEEVQNK